MDLEFDSNLAVKLRCARTGGLCQPTPRKWTDMTAEQSRVVATDGQSSTSGNNQKVA